MQTQVLLVPWDSIHGELWLRSQYPINKRPLVSQNSSNSKPGTSTVPRVTALSFTEANFVLAVTLSTLALNAGVLIGTVRVIFVALQENRF